MCIDLLGEHAQSIQCPRFTNPGQFIFYPVRKTGIEVVPEGTVTVASDLRGQPVEVHNIPRDVVSSTKHVWYSEHGMYYQFEIILERAMSATHVAVILRMRTSPAYEEEFMKMDYPDARNEYGMS